MVHIKHFKIILLLLVSLSNSWSQEMEKNINFIFILTDDQPYGFMGCTGNEIVQTPNLDQLAEEGTLFTNAHITSAICTPSRISILLSQYERKHGVNFNSGTSVAPEAWSQSYPIAFRKSGYYTGYIGKNHSPIGKGGYESGEIEKSFDYWYAGHRHLSFYPKERHAIFKNARLDTQVEIIEESAMDFLGTNEHKLEGALHFLNNRPKDKPFMLSLCFNLPHGAGTSTMEQRPSDDIIYKTLYRDQHIPLPENYIAKKDIKTPKLPPAIHRVKDRQTSYDYVDKPETVKERYIRMLQAMTGIDRLVGNLRKKLKDQGLDKNTVIVFTSDHGLLLGQYGLGGKALCYEYCTHVPLIIYHPLIPLEKSRRKSDALVQSIDIAPTMFSIAGIATPGSMQGKDLSGILSQQVASVRDYLFTENLWSTQFGNPRCESVQNKEWKYIRYYKNENFPATEKIKVAESLGINVGEMLYAVHDPDIAVYRSYIEGPLNGEKPVYEELYHLAKDPHELVNLVENKDREALLNSMRIQCDQFLQKARGNEPPKVLRYTADGMAEMQKKQD